MDRDSGKTRSLAEINHKILKDSRIIETTLSELLSKGKGLKVLEVGFGYGRALLELAWHFRNERVSFYGLNKKAQPIEKQKDLIVIAKDYGIIPEEYLANFNLPEVFFYDAARLHFDDANIDFVYSAVTVRFIERKAEFLEEVCRVLRPGGVALLDMGEPSWDYPYSRVCHEKMLTPHINRFVLKYGNELIPLPTYLRYFEKDSFEFKFLPNSRCVLKVTKGGLGAVALQLEYNDELSVPMEQFYTNIGANKDIGDRASVVFITSVLRYIMRYLRKDFYPGINFAQILLI